MTPPVRSLDGVLQRETPVLRIVGIYALTGWAWILLAAPLVLHEGLDAHTLRLLRLIEGGVFVTLTTLLLAALLRRDFQRLSAGEARYRTIFEHAPVALWEEDASKLADALRALEANGVTDLPRYLAHHPEFVREAATLVRVIDVNRAALELYRATDKDELLGTLDQMFDETSYPVFEKEISAIAEGLEDFRCEGTNRTVDGHPLNVLVRMWRPPGRTGYEKVLVAVTDVTARRQAEEQIRRLAAFAEENPNPVLELGHDGRPVYANDAACRLASELALGPVEGLLPDDHDQIAQTCLLEGKPVCRQEVTVGDRVFSWNYHPVLGGTAIHLYGGEITDLKHAARERRRLQEQVQNARKLESLGSLAAGIAHDFNNLLMVIQGNTDLVRSGLGTQTTVLTRLDRITEATSRASELTRQMLAYSGQGRFVIEPVDLNHIVSTVLAGLDPDPPSTVSIARRLSEGLPSIEGDPAQLKQVVENLVTNGVEALPDDTGSVTIRTRRVELDREELSVLTLGEDLQPGAYVAVEVTDTGMGIDPKAHDRLFDPFYSTKFLGRGLGLAVVWGIVRGHRGGIRVDAAKESGTRFQVIFPALSKTGSPTHLPAARQPTATPLPGARGQRILVVDDEDQIRTLAREALEAEGFEVAEARDGVDAVELCYTEGDRFDLVLLDLSMPRMSGEEAFHEIHTVNPDLPVLLTSGYSERASAARFAGTGLAGFIHKPYHLDELVSRIHKILGPSGCAPREP